ncbi:MAG TPA: O-methyltransferase [Candidatus Angelobacter sp.]|jgi:predicted O-methyltransferase YrrM|nr:O-methyltransferase [Candidatus Angelobacter sp.]
MAQEQWTAVDSYISDLFIAPDFALEAALDSSRAAGLPTINVSPAQGKLLHMLARMQRARSILEMGTLGGYSTIWLARALPTEGRLISLEIDQKRAEIARANVARADLSNVVEIRLGRAVDTLQQLVAEGHEPFDLIFIDADKPGYAEYLKWSLKLARPGTLVIADNVVRKGEVADPASTDENVQGIRKFNEMLAAEKSVTTTVIQTVGSKGYDGLALILVIERIV